MFSLFWLSTLLNALLLRPICTQSQDLPIRPQTNTFNFSYQLTAQEVSAAGIDTTLAANVEIALNFERSNWASGSVTSLPFYRPSSNASTPAGSLLRLEADANASAYTLPPQTAISRILYQTETLNGTLVPASAAILWPYAPRQLEDGSYPLVSWAHATSGIFPECGPSHVRNLWYHFMAPYALVQAGYVVVAPDYQGLGVGKDAQGKPILHSYLANPAQANDVFYGVQAAQAAFRMLSNRFVVVGHSQGGGVAWGAAQRQAKKHVEGYLGAVAGSPVADFISNLDAQKKAHEAPGYIGALAVRGLQSVFPDFDIRSVLTDEGARRFLLAEEIQGCNPVFAELLGDPAIYKPEWYHEPIVEMYENLTGAGNRDFAGSLLVIQGTADPVIPGVVTDRIVNTTCELFPERNLEYQRYEGATHVPVMYAAQRHWLQWIEDRFAGRRLRRGCTTKTVQSALPNSQYQSGLNWFIEYALDVYETQ